MSSAASLISDLGSPVIAVETQIQHETLESAVKEIDESRQKTHSVACNAMDLLQQILLSTVKQNTALSEQLIVQEATAQRSHLAHEGTCQALSERIKLLNETAAKLSNQAQQLCKKFEEVNAQKNTLATQYDNLLLLSQTCCKGTFCRHRVW